MNMQPSYLSASAGTFSDRIKLLIQRVGSATEIARMCGFSEGVVRSWRDGNTDPSRARCVTLARTLGISLVWLVAGEGGIQSDAAVNAADDQHNTEVISSQRSRMRLGIASISSLPTAGNGVDSQRLNTAMKIMQSELDLANSPLTLGDNTDMLTDLYEILGPGGVNVDTSAMVTFNHRLSKRLHLGRAEAERSESA